MDILRPDDQSFRLFMRRVAAPVVVVTTRGGEEARGMTASSFSSLSLDPLLVSFNVTIGSQMHAAISKAQTFVVNVLSEEQAPLAAFFALPNLSGEDQFRHWPHGKTDDGAPVLDETLGALECRIQQRIQAGDHIVVIGEVSQIYEGDEALRPLLYYDRHYVRVGRRVGSGDSTVSATSAPKIPDPKRAKS